MPESAPYPNIGDETGEGPVRGSTTGTPRWVKVFGAPVVVVEVIAAVG